MECEHAGVCVCVCVGGEGGGLEGEAGGPSQQQAGLRITANAMEC